MKKKSFIYLPPDMDSSRQHCRCENYLAYLINQPSLKNHLSSLGYSWKLAGGCCHPVRRTFPALPMHLPEPELSEESKGNESNDDEEEDEDNYVSWQSDDSSEFSDIDTIESTSDAEY